MIENFLLDLQIRNFSPLTIRAYGQTYHSLAKRGQIKMLTSSDLRQFLISLGAVAPATRNRHIAAMKSLARFMERHEGVSTFTTAVKALQGPKQPLRLPKAMTESEASLLISAASRPRNTMPDWQVARMRAAVMVLYGAGLRSAEMLSLPFNQTADVLRVTGKGRKERLVPILPIVQQAVENYKALWLAAGFKSPFLFGGLTDRDLRRMLQFLRTEAGLPDTVSPHSLRHSFATHIYQAGGDIRTLADVMGHESVRTTALYAHGDTAHLLRVVQTANPKLYGTKT